MHILHAGRENDLSFAPVQVGAYGREGSAFTAGCCIWQVYRLEPLLPTYSVHPLLPSEAIWSQFLRIQYVYKSLAVADLGEYPSYKTRTTVERDRIFRNCGRYPVRTGTEFG